MAREIIGAAANNATDRTDTGRHHAAIRQFADADGHVDMIVQQVGVSVRQDHARVDLREMRQEVIDHGHDVQAAKNDGSREREFTPGRAEFAGRFGLGVTDQLKNAGAGP